VVAGPRQVGKSTLVQQVTDELSLPVRHVSADESTLRGADWINQQWEAARLEVSGRAGGVLVLDEIQKIPAWSETVKLVAVRPDYQNKGVNSLVFYDIIPHVWRAGARFAESNPELATNTKVQSQWEDFEHVNHKRRRAYVRELGATP
jgi:GNAT superfamily N-acetyltransferase